LVLPLLLVAPLSFAQGRPIPVRPLRSQRVPPCAETDEIINGGCWYRGAHDAPCFPTEFEYKGGCYRPTAAPTKPRSS